MQSECRRSLTRSSPNAERPMSLAPGNMGDHDPNLPRPAAAIGCAPPRAPASSSLDAAAVASSRTLPAKSSRLTAARTLSPPLPSKSALPNSTNPSYPAQPAVFQLAFCRLRIDQMRLPSILAEERTNESESLFTNRIPRPIWVHRNRPALTSPFREHSHICRR